MATTTFNTISNLRSALRGGARPNLFNVTVNFPTVSGVIFTPITNQDLLCKSAAIPAMTIGAIEVPFRGRTIKVPGDRSFAEWTATFISDSAFALRKKFEDWVDTIKVTDAASTQLSKTRDSYYSSVAVKQLDEIGQTRRVYTLSEAFPTDVSAIDVSYDTTDTLQEFTVTFQYSYFTSSTPTGLVG